MQIRPRNASKKWRRKLVSSDESYQDITSSLEILEMEQSKTTEMKQNKKRKTGRKEGSYAQSIRKIKRNSGEEYTTKKSKLVSANIFQNKYCSKKCLERVECNERKSNFDNFWNLKKFKTQNLHLRHHLRITVHKTKATQNF